MLDLLEIFGEHPVQIAVVHVNGWLDRNVLKAMAQAIFTIIDVEISFENINQVFFFSLKLTPTRVNKSNVFVVLGRLKLLLAQFCIFEKF